jgi:hypothetical protein
MRPRLLALAAVAAGLGLLGGATAGVAAMDPQLAAATPAPAAGCPWERGV